MAEPAAPAPGEILIGAHRVRWDGPLLIVHFLGTLEMPEFLQLRAIADRVKEEQGRLYLLGHVEQAQGLAPEVRRSLVEWGKDPRMMGVANINAGMMIHGLATLLANAIRLVYGRFPTITFVSTEAEARQWATQLDQKRQLAASQRR